MALLLLLLLLLLLQALNYIEKDQSGGRRLTKVGQQALDQIASAVAAKKEEEGDE